MAPSKKKTRNKEEPKRPSSSSSIELEESPELEPKIEVLDPEEIPESETTVFDEESEDEEAADSPVATKDVVPYDTLSAYIREASQFPPLTREEEHELAVRYFEHKDKQAAYKLISSNLMLVVKIARDYEKAARSILDLIQEGSIGLMEAVKNFDPYRGVRFPTYAVWWIKAYVIRYVIANWRLVKLGTTQAQRKLFFNLRKEKERLEKEGFYPGPKLLAQNLQVRESDVVEMEQRLSNQDMSVDAPIQSDSDANLLSLLPADQATAEDLLAKKQLKTQLNAGLLEFGATLKPKELLIFKKRMLSEDKATLQDLAEELNLSRERIRQLETRIREKLKTFLVGKFGAGLESLDLESVDI